MFTLKSKKLFALAISCSLLLTACYPSGNQDLSTEDNSVLSGQIKDIVSDNDHLEVEAEPNENIIDELPKINVKVMEWDDDKLNKLFLESRSYLTYSEFPSDYYTDENYRLYDDETSDEAYWLVVQDGFFVLSDKARISDIRVWNIAVVVGYLLL